jgi:hypothetical protein
MNNQKYAIVCLLYIAIDWCILVYFDVFWCILDYTSLYMQDLPMSDLGSVFYALYSSSHSPILSQFSKEHIPNTLKVIWIFPPKVTIFWLPSF